MVSNPSILQSFQSSPIAIDVVTGLLARVLANMDSSDDAFRLLVIFGLPDFFVFVFASGGSGTIWMSIHLAKFNVVRLGLYRPSSFACDSFLTLAS